MPEWRTNRRTQNKFRTTINVPTAPKKLLRMKTKQRNTINSAIGDLVLTTNRYFDSIPLAQIFDILIANDAIPVAEDGTAWSGFLLGEDSRTTIELAHPDTKQQIYGMDVYVPYNNSNLVLAWHRMPSGRYEVTGYVS